MVFYNHVTQADMCRRSDSLKRKSAVSNCKAACGAGFRRKGGIGGKTQSKVLPQRLRLSFESVVDFIDTLTIRRLCRRIVSVCQKTILFASERFTFCIFFTACAGSLYRDRICLTFIIFVMNTSFNLTFYMRYGIGIAVIHCIGSA